MEASVHGSASTASRKRPRESETESQKTKREKAAERQRRKRERDRRNAGTGITAFSSAEENQHHPYHPTAALQQQQQAQVAAVAAAQQQHLQPPPPVQQQPVPPPQQQPQQHSQEQEQDADGSYIPPLTPEEMIRREKVRAAARERQRKHRMLVKQRRLRDLGLDMGNEIMPGMEEVHYRAASDGQYHQVLPPELQQLAAGPHAALQPHEPPFPQGAVLGGQTFASTLLLSFSCAPLLKQHLLRTLAMSNDELASLEPIIAEAWDRWDHQRRMHYAEQVAKNGGQPPPHMPPPPYAVELQHDPHAPPHPFPHPNGPGPTDPNQQAQAQAQAAAAANDFRARFHRSILAPAPFRTAFTDSSQTASATTPSSASGSAPAEPATIDPHLASGTPNASANANGTANAPNTAATANGATKSEPPSPSTAFDELLTSRSWDRLGDL